MMKERQTSMSRRHVVRVAAGAGAVLAGLGRLAVSGAHPGVGVNDNAGIVTSGSGDAPKRGGALNCSIGIAPTNIDPNRAAVGGEWSITQAMFNNLVRTNQKLQPVPELAVSWTPSEDLKTWTFKLRQGVKFHHGREMDADDVVASFKRVTDKATASAGRSVLSMLDTTEKVDPYTVRFQLNAPYADFASTLASQYLRVLPRDRLNTLSTAPVGTGPFMFKAFQPGDRVQVVRFDQYWEQGADGKRLPYLDGILFIAVTEASSQAAGLVSGALQVIDEVTPSTLPQLHNPQVKVLEIDSPAYQCINMRVDMDPFKDNRVRQALKYVTDRQGLLQAVFQGHGKIGSDTPVPPISQYYKEIPPLPRDVAKAKALLAAAGHGNGLSLDLVAPSGTPGLEEIGVVYAEMAADAGIKIKVRTEPFDVFLAQDFTKTPFNTEQWNGRATLDELLSLVYASSGAWNESHLANPRIDQLLVMTRAEPSLAKRQAYYGEIQQIFHDEGPIVVPYFMSYISATRANVMNFIPHPIRWVDFRSTWLA